MQNTLYIIYCLPIVNDIWNYLKNVWRFSIKHCTKMKFSITDFFNKCDKTCIFLQTWSHLLKKSLMGNFIFFCSEVQSVIHVITILNLFHLLLQKNHIQNMSILLYLRYHKLGNHCLKLLPIAGKNIVSIKYLILRFLLIVIWILLLRSLFGI